MQMNSPQRRVDATRRRECRCCGATVEDDRQAAAMHILTACRNPSDSARQTAIGYLRQQRAEAVQRAMVVAAAGGGDQVTAARQAGQAYDGTLGPRVAALIGGA